MAVGTGLETGMRDNARLGARGTWGGLRFADGETVVRLARLARPENGS